MDAPENDRRAYLEAPDKARKRIAQLLATPILRPQRTERHQDLGGNRTAPALDLMLGSRDRRDIG